MVQSNFTAAAADQNRKAGFSFAPPPMDELEQDDSIREIVRQLIEEKGEVALSDVLLKIRETRKINYAEALKAMKQLEDDGVIVKSSEDTYKLKEPDYDPQDYDAVLDYIKKNRKPVSARVLNNTLGIDTDEAEFILEEMERKKLVDKASAFGERKILIEAEKAPPSLPPDVNDGGDHENAQDPLSDIKIEHFAVLSRIVAQEFPGNTPLEQIIQPRAIGFKNVSNSLIIESDKFNEEIEIAKDKIEAAIEKDKELSVEAAYMMTGLAVAQGMKSVAVHGTDKEKVLLGLVASQFGIQISNEKEIETIIANNPDVLKEARQKWSTHLSSLPPAAQPQPRRSGPAPRPAPSPPA